jgi:hypothetical protein
LLFKAIINRQPSKSPKDYCQQTIAIRRTAQDPLACGIYQKADANRGKPDALSHMATSCRWLARGSGHASKREQQPTNDGASHYSPSTSYACFAG